MISSAINVLVGDFYLQLSVVILVVDVLINLVFFWQSGSIALCLVHCGSLQISASKDQEWRDSRYSRTSR